MVFRPGAYNSGTETFANIPQWNNYDDLGGDKTGWEYISDYFSTPLYHNIENVIRGFGDPCKLAGLTLQQVETGTIDNGTYRMARYNEMIWYMKETAQQSGTTYYGLSAGDTYLPSFDNLTTSGAMPATTKRNQGARFWVSRPGSSSSGQSLGYDNNGAVTIKSENTGNVVRCVRQ